LSLLASVGIGVINDFVHPSGYDGITAENGLQKTWTSLVFLLKLLLIYYKVIFKRRAWGDEG
jgi:hypothetical protein